MSIAQISSLLETIATVLLTTAPTVFIFSVTLLGNAIEKSEQEENAARENDKAFIQKKISELVEPSVEKAKKDGNTSALTDQLSELKKQQIDADKKIKAIKKKYSRIDLKNTVLYPCASFILLITAGLLARSLHEKFLLVDSLVLIQLLALIYGGYKIYGSLRLVQEISANKKESEHYDRLRETFTLALNEHEQAKKSEVSLTFIDKAFPLNVAASAELSMGFRVSLKKGSSVKNLSVWFFIPDEFELILPPEDKSWRQASDYSLPNIRTVKVEIGTLNSGVYQSGTLKIKTPASTGKYLLRYNVHGDDYTGLPKDLTLLVD